MYSVRDLQAMGIQLLQSTGVSSADAELTMHVLLMAERWGLGSHGMLRLPLYLDRLEAGGVNPSARLREVHRAGATAVLDGQAGLGQPQVWHAAELASDLAFEFGVAAVALGNTSHSGCLGAYVVPGLRRGLITVVMCNGPAAMPPWQGSKPLFSTSPLAAGVPGSSRSTIIDMSLSVVTRGQIASAAREEVELSDGWALDRHGRPTTDAEAALDGMLAPIGGVKGAVLAFFVEIMTGGLVGPTLSVDIADMFDPSDVERPQGIGHLLISIDPERLDVDRRGTERRDALLHLVEKAGDRIPGASRLDLLDRADVDIEVPRGIINELVGHARSKGLDLPAGLRTH